MTSRSMVDIWRCNLPPMVFPADGKTALGSVVRGAVESYGFEWMDCADDKEMVSDGIVMVGMSSQLNSLETMQECRIKKAYEGREEDMYYGSNYLVEHGKEEVLLTEPKDDYDMGESLLDWMLTEYFYYARGRFAFVGSHENDLKSLTRFEIWFGELIRRVRKVLNRERWEMGNLVR